MTLGGNNEPSVDDDIDTTAPQSSPDAWKMPEPVFRQTSGRLPKGFDKPFEPDPQVPSKAETEEPPARPRTTVLPVEPRPKSPGLKILVLVLALAAMVAFLIAFVTLIYFFFWHD